MSYFNLIASVNLIFSRKIQLFEMLSGKPLFPPDLPRLDHVALMTVIFGDFPPDMINRGRYSPNFFKDGRRS